MEIKDFIGGADNITATLIASAILWRAGLALYRKTIGSTRDLRAKLDALSCGNLIEYVENLFGSAVHRDARMQLTRWGADAKEEEVERRLYPTKHGWLTVHYVDSTVVAYAFTLTNIRFRYDLSLQTFGQIRGELGRATFEELAAKIPNDGEIYIGAAVTGYTEVHDFARSGRYQSYGLSETMIGINKLSHAYVDVGQTSWGQYAGPDVASQLEAKREKIEHYRASGPPDTFTVFAVAFKHSAYGGEWASGTIHHDQMVILDKVRSQRERAAFRRYRFWKRFM